MNRGIRLVACTLLLLGMASPTVGGAQEELPDYLRDRGEGVATSMFGTYINKGELLVYPFYEYVRDRNAEYEPAEFGFELLKEFRGEFWSHEALIFLGLGITDWLAFEFEAAVYTKAQITKAENDTSAMPNQLRESGFGDVQTQIRWRWGKETERRPEFFSYFETVYPLQKDKVLIGTAAILSRALLGVTKDGKVIASLPGSEDAVALALEKILLPELPHLVSELRR